MEFETTLDIKNHIILQDSDGYTFSQDSVLLANLARFKKGAYVLDLGSGSGILATLAVIKKEAGRALGIEVDAEEADRAARSAKLNGLEDRLSFVCGDVKDIKSLISAGNFDAVLCNPPYFEANLKLPSDGKRDVARRESTATLAHFASAAAYALKNRGEAWFVVKTVRIAEAIALFIGEKLQPKELILLKPKPSIEADAIIIRAVKGGGKGVKLFTFTCMDENGNFTPEYLKLYGESIPREAAQNR